MTEETSLSRGRQLLFICGCPRSGTTAMQRLLSGHPGACIGLERYAGIVNRNKPLSADLFDKERFFDFHSDDSYYDQETFDKHHDNLDKKYDSCLFVGDKVPTIFNRLDDVFALQPEPIVIFMLRNILDVAASYNHRAAAEGRFWPPERNALAAVKDWNASLRAGIGATQSDHAPRFWIIEYEGFFESKGQMLGLLSRLGLSTAPEETEYLEEICSRAWVLHEERTTYGRLTDEENRQLQESAGMTMYRKLSNLAIRPGADR